MWGTLLLYYGMSSILADGLLLLEERLVQICWEAHGDYYVGKNSAADSHGEQKLRFLLYDFIQKLSGWLTEALSGGSGIN
jgi:hypothetical protein